MKNYLFAPFKDNDEKIKAFKSLRDNLRYDNNQISDGDLILFIGQLESYYDVIMSDLKAEDTKSRKYILHLEEEHDDLLKACKLLKADNKELKAELNDFKSNYTWSDEVDKLKAENNRLKDGFGHGVLVELEEVDELKAENEELKAVNDEVRRCNKTMDGILLEREAELKEKDKQYHMLASSKSNDGLYDEVKELQADNEELKAELDKANNNNMRYSSLKEYKAEAEEYFHHNPKCKSLLFFMIGNDEFGVDGDWNGCYNGTLYSDDCIIEIDNEEVIA